MDQQFVELQDQIKGINPTNQNPSSEEINKWTSSFNNLIVANATKSFPCKPRKKDQKQKAQRKPANWYNKACDASKKNYHRMLNEMRKYPFDKHIQKRYLIARKDFKKKCKEAESQFRSKLQNKLLSVEPNDSKQFWKILNSMRQWGRQIPDPSDSIPPDKWMTYFKDLLNTDEKQDIDIPPQQVL